MSNYIAGIDLYNSLSKETKLLLKKLVGETLYLVNYPDDVYSGDLANKIYMTGDFHKGMKKERQFFYDCHGEVKNKEIEAILRSMIGVAINKDIPSFGYSKDNIKKLNAHYNIYNKNK